MTNGYELDGQDMSKTFLGQYDGKRKTPIYWEFGRHFVGKPLPHNAYQTRSPNIGVREGDWKLLVNYDGSMVELYNIAKDINETTNVAEQNPKITEKLKRQAIDWFNDSFRKHAGKLINPDLK